MRRIPRCDNCGSAGSIEFGMCQICYKDFSGPDPGLETELSRLLEEAGSEASGLARHDRCPGRDPWSSRGRSREDGERDGRESCLVLD